MQKNSDVEQSFTDWFNKNIEGINPAYQAPKPCPCCSRCPTCGRGAQWPYYPQPYQPYPYPYQYPWHYIPGTIECNAPQITFSSKCE